MFSKDVQRLTPLTCACFLLAGLAFAALGARVSVQRPAWLERWEHQLLDALIVHTATHQPARRTVVVDIDEASINTVGQWPWPRYRLAQLIERIAQAGPAAIGVDILFPEADRTSLVGIQAAFKRDFDVDLEFSGAPAGLTDNDGYLARVLRKHDVVVGEYFFFDHTTEAALPVAPTAHIEDPAGLLAPPVAPGVLSNTPVVAGAARYRGFINTAVDADGTLRRVPLVLAHGGTLHPGLALAAVMRAQGRSRVTVEKDHYGPVLALGDSRTAIDTDGSAVLRFEGRPALYPAVSARDILVGAVAPAALAGKVVFVGASAAGLNDVHHTAVDRLFPGLKVHAATAENLLRGAAVIAPPWAPSVVRGVSIATGILMSLLFVFSRSAWTMVLGTGAVSGLLLGSAALAFEVLGVFVAPAVPMLVVAASFIAFAVARYAVERRRARLWYARTENARQVTLESMAAVAETRDPETGAHIKRTQHYVRAVALELRRIGYHAELLTPAYIELLFASAPLHDIGKVGVPDHILLKPGKLTDEEFVLMKRHAEFGRSIVANTERLIEGENFLQLAGEIAATHHEKWDGSGYPRGLRGEEIPLSGRIMAVADVYDALISRRCYKPPFSHEKSRELMLEQRGVSFDPVVLDAFFAIEDEIRRIAATYRDEEAEAGPAEASSGQPAAAHSPSPAQASQSQPSATCR